MVAKIIFPFLLSFICLGQILEAQVSGLTFKNITIADGLSESIVLDITQDSLGFMWIATPEALNRFDGSDFKIFPKSFDHNTKQNVFRIGKMQIFGSNLWLITKGGKLELFDLEGETFTTMEHFGESGISIPPVRSILVEDENNIWIGTENEGLFLVNRDLEIVRQFDQDAVPMNKLISNKINQIFKDSIKNIWILTDQGINKIVDNSIKTYLAGIHTNLMLEDFSSRLYFGTQKKRDLYIRSKTRKIHTIKWNDKEH
jgi:ligand-binding sensor domain-containing protein